MIYLFDAFTVDTTATIKEAIPSSGNQFSSDDIERHLECKNFETLTTKENYLIFFNLRAKALNQPVNVMATLASKFGHLHKIAGKVLICKPQMFNMGSVVRKPDTADLIAQARKAQQQVPTTRTKAPDEMDLDDLLGELPVTEKKARSPKEPKAEGVQRIRTSKGEMVTFHTKDGKRITGPGVRYYVVRMDGKLHYKVAADCVLLPDDWKPGDEIPGFESNLNKEDIL